MRDKLDKGKISKALKDGASEITEKDLKNILSRKAEIAEKVKDGLISKVTNEISLFISLIEDFVTRKYTEVPWFTVAAVVAAILYVLNPLDLIPDYIPVVGELDDVAVVSLCLMLVEKDVERYKAWKEGNKS